MRALVQCHPLGLLVGSQKADWAAETSWSLEQLQSSWLVRIHLCFLGVRVTDFDNQAISLDVESQQLA